MEWYNYIACFFAGSFLANCVPHFIHGISGDKFPTPFAKPPGKGLSPPPVNVLWAMFNVAVGFTLFVKGNVSSEVPLTWILVFSGATIMGLMLSNTFQKKDKA